MYRLAVDHGVNVLQTDTDVAWLASPYPALKTHFANHSLVVQRDGPLVNAGVIYVQNARRGTGAAWLLQELARRVHLFLWQPEAVGKHVPWARPPFFANADEQTLMNDVLISSIADEITYAGSTAHWEIKQGSSRDINWETTAEKRQYDAMMARVGRSRTAIAGSAATERMLSESLCLVSSPRRDFGAWYPLHEPGAARTPSPSSYASAPHWLFAHYPADAGAWQASGHSAEQPPLCVPPALQQEQQGQQGQQGRQLAEARGLYGPPARTESGKPPYVMLHMAGIRSGAWHRRALLRAHGWWHPQADALMAAEAGWARRGLLRVAWEDGGALGALPALRPAQLDTLVSNLLLLALLSERSAVLPDTACPAPGSEVAAAWKNVQGVQRLARIHQGGVGSWLPAERCSWSPPVHDGCLRMQFITAAEHAAAAAVRAAAADPTPARAEAERCAAAAATPGARSLPAAAEAKLRGAAERRGRAAQAPPALLPADAGVAGAADALLAPLLHLLECHTHAAELVLTPAVLAPLGASPQELAARPLLRQPTQGIIGAGASKQDAHDASCIEHLLTSVSQH